MTAVFIYIAVLAAVAAIAVVSIRQTDHELEIRIYRDE